MSKGNPTTLLILSPGQWARVRPKAGPLPGLRPIDGTGLSDDEVLELLEREARRVPRSSLDELTGLPNRVRSLERLKELVLGVEEGPLWAVLIDLDHFKQINDSFGHAEGDEVLKGVGRFLQVPRDGLVLASRFGGEEFFLILQGPPSAALRVLSEIQDSLTTLRLPDGRGVTASFGVSLFQSGDSAEDLLSRADRNLYQAKSEGRNRIISDPVEGDGSSDFERELRDYENRVRVFADRLVTNLTSRGRKMALSLRDEADHDSLTGLQNRRYFDRRLEREIQRSRQLNSPLTILLLDLDDFGAVNRDYGYPAGDEALRAAAQTLGRNIRVTDWAARYGGEELCGIFPDSDGETVREVAERVRKALCALELRGVDGRQFKISGSLGVVTLQDTDLTADHLIQRAGLAVRVSKNGGKNRVTVA